MKNYFNDFATQIHSDEKEYYDSSYDDDDESLNDNEDELYND